MPSNDATPTCSVLFCFACAKRLIFSSIGILVSSSSGFSGLISQYGSLIKGVISITLPFKYFGCQSFGSGFLASLICFSLAFLGTGSSDFINASNFFGLLIHFLEFFKASACSFFLACPAMCTRMCTLN